MRKLLSLLLSAAMLVTLLSAVTLTGFADEPGDTVVSAPVEETDEAAVTEMTVAGNKIFVYAPKSELTVSSTCTAPCFIVFGDEAYTKETAKTTAEESGLAALAAAEGATVVFINPKGETWAEADAGVYMALAGMYSNSSTANFVGGISNSVNGFTGQEETKIQGEVQRIYVYAEGSGADFVAANYIKSFLTVMVFPDGNSMPSDSTPASITLFNPTALPAATEETDIVIAVVNGPDDTTEKLAALTDKARAGTSTADGFDAEWIAKNYGDFTGAYRRQYGVRLPMHDYAVEGIKEVVDTYTYEDGTAIGYVVYYANDLKVNDSKNPVPLVMTFHGGDNTALYQAQASEWPQIGKANGFITVAVDNHVILNATQTVELLEHLEEEYAIDVSRVYASGFSMGSVKSWSLFEEYPELFAGLAPMSGSFAAATGEPSGTILPVFYVGGEASILAELANQGPDIIERIGYVFKANDVIQEYSYNAGVNLWWGVNGQAVYKVTDKVAFKDSTLTVNLFKSSDGRYYTALASSGNQNHEVYARNSWAAWDFLSQFSRNEDGSISIAPVTYSLASDDGKITDNSYNTGVATTFIDVPYGEYYDAAVTWAVESGVTTGATNTTFNPGGSCTRAQIVTFLWRAYDKPEPTITEHPFTDLDPNEYYYKAVLWAYEKGITGGTGNGKFSPGTPCTRAQAVTFQWRAADKPTVTSGSSFTDVSEGQYYTDAVAWAVANNITTGTGNNRFSPDNTCTRGQIVTFLYKQFGAEG